LACLAFALPEAKTATPEELRKSMRAEVEVIGPLVKSLRMAPKMIGWRTFLIS
jgi:hypothetical protein